MTSLRERRLEGNHGTTEDPRSSRSGARKYASRRAPTAATTSRR